MHIEDDIDTQGAEDEQLGGASPAPEGEQEDTGAVPDEGEDKSVGDDDEGAEKKPSDEGEKAKADKRKKSTRQYIDELKTGKREALERAEKIERENAELKEQLAKIKAGTEDPRPKRSDYEDPDEYEAARDDWLIRQATKGRTPADSAEKKPPLPSAEDMARVDNARLLNQVGEERHEDYQTVVRNPDAKYSVEVFDAVASLDDPEIAADIFYYFGNNPAKAAELSRLKGSALAIQVGRIAAGIEAGSIDIKAKSKQPSSAPKPIKPLGGGNSRPATSANATNMDDYIARRRKEREAAGKR